MATSTTAFAGEANLLVPSMAEATFPLIPGINGFWLLVIGLVITFATLGISIYFFFEIKKLPTHKKMADVADTIYATCCAYLWKQIVFLACLFGVIALAFLLYVYATSPAGWLSYQMLVTPEIGSETIPFYDFHGNPWALWLAVLLFSFVGMGGATLVAWYGIRVNTYANARTAFASLEGKPWNVVNIPLRAGMSVGLFLIAFELVIMVSILLLAKIPMFPVGICFLGFAIGEALGASALRIAGGIFTKIADIGSDLMKIVFKVDEDDPRNPGVIADCTGDNAGDSVGPTADGFETYGVTGVALIAFIALAITPTTVQPIAQNVTQFQQIVETRMQSPVTQAWMALDTEIRQMVLEGRGTDAETIAANENVRQAIANYVDIAEYMDGDNMVMVLSRTPIADVMEERINYVMRDTMARRDAIERRISADISERVANGASADAARVAARAAVFGENDTANGMAQVLAQDFALEVAHSPVSNIMQALLIVWLFFIRMLMGFLSGVAYFINQKFAYKEYANLKGEVGAAQFEKTLTHLIFWSAGLCILAAFLFSFLLLSHVGGGIWWKMAGIVSCGTLAAVLIPEFTKIFTSSSSKHVQEVVVASNEGPSFNILSGIVAGNYSAFWTGSLIAVLMALAYMLTWTGELAFLGQYYPIFAFGLVAFGFLGMGPVTIAVDSYGPVTDNAQSIFELSQIEKQEGIKEELQRDFGFTPDFELGKHYLEANDGAGNTFKATAKPVLIGTAVAGATTMIFAIILMLESMGVANLALTQAPIILGFIMGAAVIFWFSGAATQAVVTGAYEAVEFIKRTFDMSKKEADIEDAKNVVRICTEYAQKGMWNIFLALFFLTLAFAFIDPNFFVSYLVAIAVVGLFQAIYMANAGGSWDNAKKVVEVDMKDMKGTPLHDSAVIGDTVGDPFKDTSSVSLNPIIKFSTLLGLLAVEVAVIMKYISFTSVEGGGFIGTVCGSATGPLNPLTWVLSAVFLGIGLYFVWRSFYCTRIPAKTDEPAKK